MIRVTISRSINRKTSQIWRDQITSIQDRLGLGLRVKKKKKFVPLPLPLRSTVRGRKLRGISGSSGGFTIRLHSRRTITESRNRKNCYGVSESNVV